MSATTRESGASGTAPKVGLHFATHRVGGEFDPEEDGAGVKGPATAGVIAATESGSLR